MRSHRDDISADPNMDSHPYDNFLDALAEFISKNQSKYDQLLQQSQENYQKFQKNLKKFSKKNQKFSSYVIRYDITPLVILKRLKI